jgi:LPS sulfotransferase NodH
MPTKRAPNGKRPTRLEVLETQARIAAQRLDRIERALEAQAQATQEFQATVRGAFTVQQEQISELYRTVEQLTREWQAYLRTIHPPQ